VNHPVRLHREKNPLQWKYSSPTMPGGLESRSALASRRHARALAAGLPRRNHVYIITNESFRFHNNELAEIRCKLDSTENPRLLRNTQLHLKGMLIMFEKASISKESWRDFQCGVCVSHYSFNWTPEPRMYLDHERNQPKPKPAATERDIMLFIGKKPKGRSIRISKRPQLACVHEFSGGLAVWRHT